MGMPPCPLLIYYFCFILSYVARQDYMFVCAALVIPIEELCSIKPLFFMTLMLKVMVYLFFPHALLPQKCLRGKTNIQLSSSDRSITSGFGLSHFHFLLFHTGSSGWFLSTISVYQPFQESCNSIFQLIDGILKQMYIRKANQIRFHKSLWRDQYGGH